MLILYHLKLNFASSLLQWGKVNTVKFGILELQMDPSNNFGSYRSCLKAAMWRAHGATETREKVSICGLTWSTTFFSCGHENTDFIQSFLLVTK